MPLSSVLSSQSSMTQVYAVIGGFDYEGEDFSSLHLFDCKSSAEAYKNRLVDVDGYDYAKMEKRWIDLNSAILPRV